MSLRVEDVAVRLQLGADVPCNCFLGAPVFSVAAAVTAANAQTHSMLLHSIVACDLLDCENHDRSFLVGERL